MKKLIIPSIILLVVFCACSKIDPNAHECEIATWKDFSKSAVTYTFDDDLHNQFSVALPLFDKYGYKATFYTNIDKIDNWQTLAQCSENGHEIGSHTVNHWALSSLSTDDLDEELRVSKETLENNIEYSSCLTLAYPYCDMPDTNYVSKYYLAARICDCRIESATPRSFYSISSFGVGRESSDFKYAAPIINLFDKNRLVGGWCVLLIHEVDEGDGYSPISSAAIDSTLQYANDNEADFWVAPFVDVVKYIKERDLTSVILADMDETSITLSFSNLLDCVYDYPISVKRPLPSSWDNVVVMQNRDVCNSYVSDGYVYFDVVPNKGEVLISKE